MTEFEWQDQASGFLEIGGSRLEYVCHGPPPDQAYTIILLHEGLGCVGLWKDFPQALSDTSGFGVFAYSRAGYGKSSPVSLPRPLDYMTREAVDILPCILDAIGFRHGVLMGHSDGATIAAIHAGMAEDFRVRGLVLMAPHFFTEPDGLAAIAEARESFENTDLREKLGRYHDDPENAFCGWNDAWLDPGFEEWNVSDVIDYFRIPVLAIQGSEDQYGTMAQIDEIENRIYSPFDTLILNGCGHAPHVERRAETLAAVSEFTTRLERIESTVVSI
ncbi:MAG: alpha/beta hydrolase [Pseudomonadota bacterium]